MNGKISLSTSPSGFGMRKLRESPGLAAREARKAGYAAETSTVSITTPIANSEFVNE